MNLQEEIAQEVADMDLKKEISRHEQHFMILYDGGGYLPNDDQIRYVELCKRCLQAEACLDYLFGCHDTTAILAASAEIKEEFLAFRAAQQSQGPNLIITERSENRS